jgi:hypothetical protein
MFVLLCLLLQLSPTAGALLQQSPCDPMISFEILSPVIFSQSPFVGPKSLLWNFRVEYLQIVAGDFTTQSPWGR